jgi:hypothetical protein
VFCIGVKGSIPYYVIARSLVHAVAIFTSYASAKGEEMATVVALDHGHGVIEEG